MDGTLAATAQSPRATRMREWARIFLILASSSVLEIAPSTMATSTISG